MLCSLLLCHVVLCHVLLYCTIRYNMFCIVACIAFYCNVLVVCCTLCLYRNDLCCSKPSAVLRNTLSVYTHCNFRLTHYIIVHFIILRCLCILFTLHCTVQSSFVSCCSLLNVVKGYVTLHLIILYSIVQHYHTTPLHVICTLHIHPTHFSCCVSYK